MYDPVTGRYTQPDPLRFVDGPSVYAYAKNSPYMYTDRDGQCPMCLAVGLGLAGGLAYEYFTNGDCATFTDYAKAAFLGAILGAGGEVVGGVITGFRLAGAGGSAVLRVTAAASRAGQAVGPGSGSIYGTAVHTAFGAEVKALGAGFQSEVSYLNGAVVRYGTAGSVRLDAVAGTAGAPTAIFDLKTGAAVLSPARIQQILSHVPSGSSVPIHVVRP